MPKILRQNVSGIDYTMAGCSITGTCASAEESFVKIVSLLDADAIYDGMLLAVKFTSGNSAGTAPNYITLYSSDQITYYSDAELTQPYSLAPEGCYELEYTGTGNAYDYISFPVLSVEGIVGPVVNSTGSFISQNVWGASETGLFLYVDNKFMLVKTTDSGIGVGGLAFVGTRAQYNTAKLIPYGQPGFIPSGALVCITDENDYVMGDEQ